MIASRAQIILLALTVDDSWAVALHALLHAQY